MDALTARGTDAETTVWRVAPDVDPRTGEPDHRSGELRDGRKERPIENRHRPS
jgi:hypothetical protein